MSLRTIASLILIFSFAVPWTVFWGTNTMGGVTSQFYIFEFPFMAYCMVAYGSQGTSTWWEPYTSAPKYLGAAMVLLGGILAFVGVRKREGRALIERGGICSVLGSVFFSGSSSAEIFIPFALAQQYTSLPLGLFIPAVFWLIILSFPEETVEPLMETSLFCGECGRGISLQFDFCPFCGTKSRGLRCQECGRKIPAQQKFCPFCGARKPR